MEDKSHVVIVGGPGQGKSTLSQLICQAYRISILRDRDPNALDFRQKELIKSLDAHIFDTLRVPEPRNKRWPIHLRLSEFSDEIVHGGADSLLKFIAKKINETGQDSSVDPAGLKEWLRTWPWLLVLDGLDEVPSMFARDRIVTTLENFLTDCRAEGYDVFIVATTRPHGYTDEMSPDVYQHLQLMPLDQSRARAYVNQLTNVRYGSDPDAVRRIGGHLNSAFMSAATAKLMTTPLQLTIMTILMAKRQKLPQSRHQLFSSYFEVIYDREANKELGDLGDLFVSQRRSIEYIHQKAGFTLHQRAEQVGYADALLSRDELAEMIYRRFKVDEQYDHQRAYLMSRDLMKVATERLVLLVPRVADHFGFEIRSLQEFMAAAFFFYDGESEAFLPLSVTLKSAHWRNSWLLAAGRAFDDRQSMREGVVGLVEGLSSESRIIRAAGTGPSLSVDILADGLAHTAPKFSRRLIKLGLDFLDLPPGVHSSGLHQALRAAAESDRESRELIQDKLRLGLKSSGASRISSILALASWRRSAELRESSRLLLAPVLARVEDPAAAALIWAAKTTGELDMLSGWEKRDLIPAETRNLAEVLDSAVKRGVRTKLLPRLRRIMARRMYYRDTDFWTIDWDLSNSADFSALLYADDRVREWTAETVLEVGYDLLAIGSFFSSELANLVALEPVKWPDRWEPIVEISRTDSVASPRRAER
ncbi:hypothetical protein SCMU_20420 [Sinomonas cyclohexanicum]|uniref:NACHT domain-containing protein n=1 Tax=Sinomonas cyclohexanicum TaxID=322009 RepID=A0ABM7PVB8_SINCY|nr:hypothetical protein SCMU_20420 [Corynebacterium cyclohexanicum]